MGLLIVRLGPEKFAVWPNTVDAPVTQASGQAMLLATGLVALRDA